MSNCPVEYAGARGSGSAVREGGSGYNFRFRALPWVPGCGRCCIGLMQAFLSKAINYGLSVARQRQLPILA
eukprot:270285-Pelagomonas_calceolata.AAC.3